MRNSPVYLCPDPGVSEFPGPVIPGLCGDSFPTYYTRAKDPGEQPYDTSNRLPVVGIGVVIYQPQQGTG